MKKTDSRSDPFPLLYGAFFFFSIFVFMVLALTAFAAAVLVLAWLYFESKGRSAVRNFEHERAELSEEELRQLIKAEALLKEIRSKEYEIAVKAQGLPKTRTGKLDRRNRQGNELAEMQEKMALLRKSLSIEASDLEKLPHKRLNAFVSIRSTQLALRYGVACMLVFSGIFQVVTPSGIERFSKVVESRVGEPLFGIPGLYGAISGGVFFALLATVFLKMALSIFLKRRYS